MSPCWNSILHFPPCRHTLAERLALMWLAAIQVYERNEQMFLFPPITTFHLALPSSLYSMRSTFSLHFPLTFPTSTVHSCLKTSKKQLRKRNNLISSGGSLSALLSPTLRSVSTCSQTSEARKMDEQTFYVQLTSTVMKQESFKWMSTLKSQTRKPNSRLNVEIKTLQFNRLLKKVAKLVWICRIDNVC